MENQERKTQTKKESAKPALHAGHRQRMFEKLSSGALCEHELLEMLLFYAIPRRNTNEIAHRLLGEFKTIAGVFHAPLEELMQVEGIGKSSADFLQCIGALVGVYSREKAEMIPAYYNTESFMAYLAREYAGRDKEVMDIYCLANNARIYCRRRCYGNEDSVETMTRWLNDVIAELNPTGIVVVHNHPSGSFLPSTADRVLVEKIQSICLSQGILLCDFCIVASGGVFSFYKVGALKVTADTMIRFNNREEPLVDTGVDCER